MYYKKILEFINKKSDEYEMDEKHQNEVILFSEMALDELLFTNSEEISNKINSTIISRDIIKKEQGITVNPVDIINACRDQRLEDNITTVQSFYNSFRTQIKKENYSNDVIQIGYYLTDIYEKNEKFHESVEIASVILDLYENKKIARKSEDDIRKMIGCAYSLTIACEKIDNGKRLLDRASRIMDEVQPECEKFFNDNSKPAKSRYEIMSLYYNDCGSLYQKIGRLSEENYDDRKKYYDIAKKNYTEGLKLREYMLEYGLIDKKVCEELIARTLRHIASIEYNLGNYHEGIRKHEEALKKFESLNNESNMHKTKEYIVGTWIELLEKDNPNKIMDEKELVKYCLYIRDLLRYYKKNTAAYNNILNKKDRIIKLIETYYFGTYKQYLKDIATQIMEI